MVRQMKCPFCGNMVSVSSHWETATCSKCHQNFEITVDVFELTEEEQAKEMEAAKQKIQADEARRDERTKETRKRLRAAFHLPEEDPHANVKFEDDEKNDSDAPAKEPMDRKKMLILGGCIGVVLLFIIIFVIFIKAALGARSGAASTQSGAAQPAQTQVQTEAVTSDGQATVEQHDGSWVDGFAIDSNNEDGKYMIDLQSSDGDQREVTLTPDVADESTQTDAAPAQGVPGVTDDSQATENVEGQKDLSETSGEVGGDTAHTANNIESDIPAGDVNVPTSEDTQNELLNGEWE